MVRPALRIRRFCPTAWQAALLAALLGLPGAARLGAGPPTAQPASGPAPPPAGQAAGEFATVPVDVEAEAALCRELGPSFRIKRTTHFAIAHDADDAILNEFVGRVEATYRSVFTFLRINAIPHAQPPWRLEIGFFAKYDDFARYAAGLGHDVRGTWGFYNPADNRAVFFHALDDPRLRSTNRAIALRTEQARNSRSNRAQLNRELRELRNQRDALIERINQLVVQHEVAHQCLFNAGVHVRGGQNPLWLVEGLANIFETPPGDNGAGIAITNQSRLHDFRKCLSSNGRVKLLQPEHFAQSCASGMFAPLSRLISDAGIFEGDPAKVVNYYAQAWSLVFFLQRCEREKLAEYLGLVGARKPGQIFTPQEELALFESVFDPLDEVFERRWVSFILDLRYQPPARLGK